MKDYSQSKFKDLSHMRKAQIVLLSIQKIEAEWGENFLDSPEYKQLLEFFDWLMECDLDAKLAQLRRLHPGQTEDLDLRKLLNIAVHLERYLNIHTKDENIIPVDTIDQMDRERQVYDYWVVLDHIRSAYNVGNIMRTSECLGAKELHFVGYTPLPDNEMLQKTSMGTFDQVPWKHFHHLNESLEIARKDGRKIYALETSPEAQPLTEFHFQEPFCVVLGNERFGLESDILKEVDEIIRIPMMGVKNSLNVANCFSIFAFELSRQWSGRREL